MAEFYYRSGETTVGPLTGIELRKAALARQVVRDTLVSANADGPWVSATRVKGLFDSSGRPLPHPPETQQFILQMRGDQAAAVAPRHHKRDVGEKPPRTDELPPATTWWYQIEGMVSNRTEGPVNGKTLVARMRSGEIRQNTLVSSPQVTNNDWMLLEDIPIMLKVYQDVQVELHQEATEERVTRHRERDLTRRERLAKRERKLAERQKPEAGFGAARPSAVVESGIHSPPLRDFRPAALSQAARPVYGGASVSQQVHVHVHRPPKSAAVALLLTFLFGPFGVLYSTVAGGLIMLAVSVFVAAPLAVATLGLSLLVTAPVIWIVSMVWAVVACD